jgi:AAA+ superfamily predicted ATPase
MPNSNEINKHLVIDLKTGRTYGLVLDGKGQCMGIQSLVTSIEREDGKIITKLGRGLDDGEQDDPATPEEPLPYGKTIIAIEPAKDDKKAQIFTISLPSKEEMDKGARPVVAVKPLTDDLVRSGVAAAIKGLEDKKNKGFDEATLKEALKAIDDMIGLDKAKVEIKQNIAIARFNQMKEEMGLSTKPISRHMVFTGNPGTGKTTFAREVAKVYHALGLIKNPTVHEVKREDLVAGFVGQTAIKTKEQIDKAKGGILFIDEAYALSRDAGGSSGDSKDFGREAIDTLVAAMENMRDDLVVIVAGYPEPMKKFIDANEGLKSRFMTYIGFEDYTMPQLTQIMDFMLKDRGYTMSPEARDHAIALLTEEKERAQKDFGNGRTVRNLVEKAEKELAMRLDSENKLRPNNGMTPEEFKKELTTITFDDMFKVSLAALDKVQTKRGFEFGKAAARNDNTKQQMTDAPLHTSRTKSHKPAYSF